MKTAPRLPGVFIDDKTGQAHDALPVEGALALAKSGGARQRPLDLLPVDMVKGTSPDEVIKLIDELKPKYRSTRVRRGDRTFLVVTDRQ